MFRVSNGNELISLTQCHISDKSPWSYIHIATLQNKYIDINIALFTICHFEKVKSQLFIPLQMIPRRRGSPLLGYPSPILNIHDRHFLCLPYSTAFLQLGHFIFTVPVEMAQVLCFLIILGSSLFPGRLLPRYSQHTSVANGGLVWRKYAFIAEHFVLHFFTSS